MKNRSLRAFALYQALKRRLKPTSQTRNNSAEVDFVPRSEEEARDKDQSSRDDEVVCTICVDPLKRNARLCSSCQAWDDLTHLLYCKWGDYPLKNPEVFTTEVVQSWKVSPQDIENFYQELTNAAPAGFWDWLAMIPLEGFSGHHRKDCMLCQLIKEAVDDHLRHHRFVPVAAKVGSWRPFPVLYWKPREKRSNNVTPNDDVTSREVKPTLDDGANLNIKHTNRFVLPLAISTVAADGQRTIRLKTLELELQFDELDCGLRTAARWYRKTIDADYVKAWLERCQADHGLACNPMRDLTKLPPSFRLIDTKKWCIVNPTNHENIRYLALSYVWGAAEGTTPSDRQPLQSEQRNVAMLEQPNNLLRADGNLPALLADAIQLTADLGYRYLWVDRLCIIQDDPSQQSDQINAMDVIYQSADLTIVALADQVEGLPGTSSRPRRASLSNKTWELHMKRLDVWADLPKIHRIVTNSRWNSRGWTYQERILSRRHLFMTRDLIYLNCPKSLASYAGDGAHFEEKTGYEKGIHDFNQSGSDVFDTAYTVYASTVKDYTKRKLTHKSDKLNAFLGVASAFASQCETSVLFGIPEKYFTPALAWHPAKYAFCVPREQHQSLHCRVPSWSWAAWEGAVSYNPVYWHLQEQRYSMAPGRLREFGALVRFKYSDPETMEIRPIQEDPNWFGEDEYDRQPKAFKSWEHEKEDDISADVYALAKSLPGSLLFNTEVAKAKLRRFADDIKHDERGGSAFSHFNIASMQELESVLGTGRSGFQDLDRDYDSADSDADEKEETILDIVGLKDTTVGQTMALWTQTEGQAGKGHVQGSSALQKMMDAQQEYTVAVIAACRSNRKLARGSNDRQALTVLVLEEDIDREVYRRLAIGAVDLDSWELAKPERRTVILV